MPTKIYSTKKYEIYDLNYGLILINKTPIDFFQNSKWEKSYESIFFQGDEATNFLLEIEQAKNKNIKKELIDNWLSEYDPLMQLTTKNDLININIIKQNTKNKP